MAVIDDSALDQIFRKARTSNGWTDTPVTDAEIRAIYELFKWGPTSVNSNPARIVWVRSEAAKQRLLPHLTPTNQSKSAKAPVIAIIGHDLDFPETLPKLFPHAPQVKDVFASPGLRDVTAFRNGSLQGAYLIIAARAVGLDAGPMSGFDNAGVDKEFFAGTNIKSNFICAIGHSSGENLFPRNPRLDFEDANTIV